MIWSLAADDGENRRVPGDPRRRHCGLPRAAAPAPASPGGWWVFVRNEAGQVGKPSHGLLGWIPGIGAGRGEGGERTRGGPAGLPRMNQLMLHVEIQQVGETGTHLVATHPRTTTGDLPACKWARNAWSTAVGGVGVSTRMPVHRHGRICQVQIGMLGPFEVRTDDGVLADVPGARLRALLIALALEPGHVVPKATLVDWIWGEHPPSDAANALQRLVSRLRKALPEGSVEGQTDGYRLTVEPDAVDAVRFERLVGQARNGEDPRRVRLLREALALWRGAAMQDVGLQDSAAFDAAVTRLEGLRLTAMEDRFDAEISLGHGAELVTELTDLVAAHPVRERLVAALMRALVAAGRDTEALLVYERTREALADALGVDPSPELSALHVALLRGELGRREENRKTNLRAELTSFVGKDADVAVVRELVAEHRLTTLIGPGGSGKTRLATETARTLLGDLPDGAWLVELAAIGADGDVAQATLAGLGLRDALLGEAPSAELTDRLIAAIRDREALLILDNCEHVIESAAMFADRVLGECRRLRILATSREPLGITGEALWLVEPLALPDGGRRARRDRVLSGRPAAAGPGGRGAQGSRGRRPHVVDDGARLPGAGRDAAGDRAGRGQVAHHVPRSARQPARRPVPSAHRRQPYRVAAAPDAARGGRLELGAAHRCRTDGPAPALGVLGRGEPGGGRAGLRRRRGRARRRCSSCSPRWPRSRCWSPRATAHRATG